MITLFGRPVEDVIEDLEILDMLKKKMTINFNIDFNCEIDEYIAYNGVYLHITDKKEFNKIKEWIENDKQSTNRN